VISPSTNRFWSRRAQQRYLKKVILQIALLLGALLLAFFASSCQQASSPVVSADFGVDKTEVVVEEDIQFSDLSSGDVTSWRTSAMVVRASSQIQHMPIPLPGPIPFP